MSLTGPTLPEMPPPLMRAHDLTLLAAPFDTADVEWKPGAVTRDKSKGLAMAYLTSRAVQDRLDAVCGPADWRNEYRPGPDGGVVCGISVYVERRDGEPGEWVTKWDGADNTDVEAVKGGLSGSMKRAAVMWGIGRSLYGLPVQWVRLDERGRFAEPPRLPRSYAQETRPEAPRPSVPRSEAPRQEPQRTEAARPEALRTSPPPSGAPLGDVSRNEAPRGDAPARRPGSTRIVRSTPGRPGEGDGGSRTVDPSF